MKPHVNGQMVDDQTRCVHYRTELDVVAIRFACCDRWYPCHLCHAAAEQHPAEPWSLDQRDAEAVLCGVCRSELPIREYLHASACPRCGAAFNPRCALHYDLYFEMEPSAAE